MAGGVGAVVVLVMLAVGPLPGFVRPWSSAPDASAVDGVGPEGPGLAATHADPAPTTSPTDGRALEAAGGASAGSSSGSSSGDAAASSSSSGQASGGVPVPPPVVIVEAEAASVVRSGTATVTTDPAASGGAYVSGLGYWNGDPAGTLEFTGVDLPSAGHWQLNIWFLDPGPNGPRHATVAVSGASPMDVMFAGWPTCCGSRTVDLNLTAGTHSILISNSDNVAPSIDRISFALVP